MLLCSCTTDPNDHSGDVQFLRDPASGMCMPIPVDFGGGNGGSATPWSGWESCSDPCASLDEKSCSADPRCKARYEGGVCEPNETCLTGKFAGCDAVPVADACLGLDEKTCGATRGCEPVYGGVECDCADGSRMCACPAIAVYRGCKAAQPMPLPSTCTSDVQCGARFHCSTSDGVCGPAPGCDKGEACPAVCGGTCVPDDGGTTCFGIHDEKTCIARADCEPVYQGSRCFCDSQGCGCLEYVFDSCRPQKQPPPMPPTCDLALRSLVGSWVAGARTYKLESDGTFTVSDKVAPCPPDGVCFWSGIVTNRGTWSLSAAGTIALVYSEPVMRFEGLVVAKELVMKGCSDLVELETGRVFSPL